VRGSNEFSFSVYFSFYKITAIKIIRCLPI
jgi:hypothetical protein